MKQAMRIGVLLPLLAAVLLDAGMLPAQTAAPAPPSFVADLGAPGTPLYPSWLKSLPPVALTATQETSFEVTRPDGLEAGSGDLLLTVFFDERDGGFLRVYRKDQEQARTLSDNLYEGTGPGVTSQRTLLIPGIGATPTTIVFQAPAGAPPVRRLVWEWPQTRPVATLRFSASPVLIRHDAVLTAEEVSGQPPAAPAPGVEIDYTATPLLGQPARIDGAVVFTAALDRLPAQARLAGRVAGLPPGEELECWINGQRAGTFALPLPPLRDPAWFRAAGQAPLLAGWRAGSVALPAPAWIAGENQIEFRPIGSETASYALKDLVLELVYDDAPPAPASAPPTPTPSDTPAP